MLYPFKKLLQHYASATLIDVLHSPFVFGLYNECFKRNSTIRLDTTADHNNGYFNKRSSIIIEKLKLRFPGHYFTTDISQLTNSEPFIFLTKNNFPIELLRQKLLHVHNDSMVVITNMYANPATTLEWEQLKKLPAVTASIDLFFVGIVFVRKEQRRQEFRLRLL